MKNMDEVRESLTTVYEGLKAGTIKHHDACEMNNACGKIIASIKVELEYYQMLKQAPPRIPFLDRAAVGRLPAVSHLLDQGRNRA